MIKEVIKPGTLEEAVKLKKADIFYLGGGTQINWTPARESRKNMGLESIEKVIILKGLLSSKIEMKGRIVSIGAGITLQNLIDSPITPFSLKKAAGFIASRNIRNMATLGGNIAANRADSYIIPCLIALTADVETVDEGIISVEEYSGKEKISLIKRIIFPNVKGICIIDVALKSSAAYPSVTTAVRVSEHDAIVAVGCVADHVIRLKELEPGILDGTLAGQSLTDAVAKAVNPISDLQGSAEYKRYIAGSMVAHAVEIAGNGVQI